MPDVDHVTGAVRNTTFLCVLASQDEFNQGVPVDPMHAPDDLQAAQDPPAVTDVLVLLGPAIQTAARKLSLGKPTRELVHFDKVEAFGYGQGGHACEDLARMRLRTGTDTVAAVKIGTSLDVFHSARYIDEVEESEQRQSVEGTIEETSILLAPLVTSESACFSVLKVGNNCKAC